VRSQTLIVVAASALGLAVAPGCRTYRGALSGALSLVPGVHLAEPAPMRPSGTETRSAFELSNGMRVILEENHATSVVSIQAWIDAGSLHDPVDRPGVAWLLEELVLRAPRLATFAGLGGRVAGWTSHDAAMFRATVAGTFSSAALAALSEALIHPDWSPATFDATLAMVRRGGASSARQTGLAQQRGVALLALGLAFGPGGYARPVVPAPEQIARLGTAELRRFHDELYVAPRVDLVVVGDFKAAEMRASLQRAFGTWPAAGSGGSSAQAVAVPPPLGGGAAGGPRLTVVAGSVTEPEIAVGFRTPPTRHGDLPALELLAAVAGRPTVGRLAVDVAQNRQMASATGAYLFGSRQGGLLLAHATLTPGPIDDAAGAVIDTLLRLGSERLDRDELERARVAVEGEDAARRASLDGYATRLGWFASLTGKPGYERTYRERLRTVDADELRKVAARYLRASNMVVAVLVPGRRADVAAAAATAPDAPPSTAVPSTVMARLERVLAACEQRAPAPLPTRRASAAAVGQDDLEYRLTSGVRLLVIPDDTATQVSLRAVWSGGARTEDARLAGASALLARLLPLGTRSRRAEPLASEMTEIAGNLAGIAGADVFGLRADFLATRWERGVELVVDVLRNPRFAEEDVERERRVQLDLIRDDEVAPAAVALRTFREAVYGGHPYRRDPLGTVQSVSALTRRRLLDHYRFSYRPSSLTIAVVGAVPPSELANKLQTLFSDASPAAPSVSDPVSVPPRVAPQGAPLVVERVVGRPGGAGAGGQAPPQAASARRTAGPTPGPSVPTRVVLGYLGLTVQDPDRFAFDVLVEILTGRGTPLLAEEAVDGGFLAISFQVDADASVDEAVAALRRGLATLTAPATAPTAEEVARASRLLVGRSALAFERRGAVAMALALHGALGESVPSYRRAGAALAEVQVADVLRVARRVIDPGREVLVIIRPEDQALGPRERDEKSVARMNQIPAGFRGGYADAQGPSPSPSPGR
jgi:zinc protease